MVGIGPGNALDRTERACRAIKSCDLVVGYNKYIALVEDLIQGKECVATGMTQEVMRVKIAIDAVQNGRTVALISSGDSGVYGMAGLVFDLVESHNLVLDIEIIPGISAANAAGARLGAPLMLDYCCISLSNILIPWSSIEIRLESAGRGDMVVALYNPRSKKRKIQLEEAVRILLKFRSKDTPVGVVRQIGLADERILLTTLGNVLCCEVDMHTTLIIGNSTTRTRECWMWTPRGYLNKTTNFSSIPIQS